MRALTIVLCCVAVGSLLAAEASAFYFPRPNWYSVTQDPDTRGDFLTGYLTWNGGKGGISWSPTRTSEELAGPAPNADQDQRYDLQAKLKAQGIKHQLEPLPVFEFVSDPLPTTIYVNSSRNVHYDLRLSRYTDKTYSSYYDPCQYYKLAQNDFSNGIFYLGLASGEYTGDPILALELLNGDTLVSGTSESSYIQWYYFGNQRPADPDGFGTCRYRMPIEMAIIPAGTVLKLRITHVEQHQGFQYGLKGDHESTIRIPIFPPEEILFRDPGRVPDPLGEEADGEAEASATGTMAPKPGPEVLLPLAGVPLLAVRRRSRGPLLAALFLGLAFAGCVGGDAGPSDDGGVPTVGRASSSLQPIGGIGGTAAGLGAVVGQIHDDIHTPVSGAHVSLLRTNNFTTSDGRGSFLIPGVPPGIYELRVDRKGYQSLQSEVEIRANNVTRVDVLLVPVDKKEVGLRPHRHDLWGFRTEWSAMNEPLGATCYDDPTTDCYIQTYFTLPPKREGETNIVFPGTGEAEITIDWNKDAMGARRAGLMVRSNQAYNYSVLAPREPSVPFKLPVTWEMTDNGHQAFSTWYFQIYVPLTDVFDPTPLPEYRDPPTFRVEVTLRRAGALPLEPAHPDRWGDKQWKVVQPGANLYNYWNYYPPGTPYYYSYPLWFYPREVIPVGTTWIQVNITASRNANVAHDMTLAYKPGNTPYNGNNWKDAPAPKVEGLKRIYRFAIQEDESDSHYARGSTFAFQARFADENARWLDGASGPAAPIQYSATVIAHRDPMPT